MTVQRAEILLRPQIRKFCIEKHGIILQDVDYNGAKYITSEEGFQQFETNFMKEIRNNFRIWETLDIDNSLSEILNLELDIENSKTR